MSKIRRNIKRRIKSTSFYQEPGVVNGKTWNNVDKGTNTDEGSRSLAFCSVSGKTTVNEPLKVKKKRKKKKGKKHNASPSQESNFPTESIPIHLSTGSVEVVDSYKTECCKPKVCHFVCTVLYEFLAGLLCQKWNSKLKYGLFLPQTSCTRLRWRKCFAKRMT